MKKMHHTRENYELYLTTLCRETREKMPENISKYPDFKLLLFLNNLLIKHNCTPLTEDELELELI